MDQPITFQQRCLLFSAKVLRLVEKLPKSHTSRTIADQLFRSGTSVGANVQEAKGTESRADFIHKFQVALKEAQEAAYWLALIQLARIVDDAELPRLAKEATEIAAILAQSVITAKKNGGIAS